MPAKSAEARGQPDRNRKHRHYIAQAGGGLLHVEGAVRRQKVFQRALQIRVRLRSGEPQRCDNQARFLQLPSRELRPAPSGAKARQSPRAAVVSGARQGRTACAGRR